MSKKTTHSITKRVKLIFSSKNHGSDKKVSRATPATLLDVTAEPLQPISTTSQVTDTDKVRISNSDPSPALPDDIGSPDDQSLNIASATRSQVKDTDTARKSNTDPSAALPDDIGSPVDQSINIASSIISQVTDTDTARKSNNDSNAALPNDIGSPVDHPTDVASKTPIWDQAGKEFREKCKADYEKLKFPAGKTEYEELGLSERGIEFENSILNKKPPEAFKEEERHSHHAVLRRLRGWIPFVISTRVVAMTLARLDPHQLAPYIVAGAFFFIEVGLTFQFNFVIDERHLFTTL